jgi:hypothetical protein
MFDGSLAQLQAKHRAAGAIVGPVGKRDGCAHKGFESVDRWGRRWWATRQGSTPIFHSEKARDIYSDHLTWLNTGAAADIPFANELAALAWEVERAERREAAE